jgi:cell fate regulator YaaT (PSP1 superfamily)
MSTQGQRPDLPRPMLQPTASRSLNEDVEGKVVADLSSPSETHPVPGPITSSSDGANDHSQILEVQFKGLRSEFFTFSSTSSLREHEYVVTEVDRGQDIGWVKRIASADTLSCGGGCDQVGARTVPLPSLKVIRRAAPADVIRLFHLRDQEMEVRRRTREMVAKRKLRMKVSEAEWQWDRNKLTVYFTAEKRVDFRQLVRDMARTFRTRIELRQIGVRDEARRLGGIGRCRQELCCRSWLTTIEPVTLQLAKDQGLSLNPGQISGACGRLMNCLHYEHAMYTEAKKSFPAVGDVVGTSLGQEHVKACNLFDETVSLQDAEGETRTIPLAQLKDEMPPPQRSDRDLQT